MKKALLILLPLLAVGCGKGELGTNARNVVAKGLNDGFNTTGKAIKDTFAEADRSADSVITKANDAKNTIASNTGNFTEGIGKGAESLGQAPKNIINALIENDDESDKRDKELEDDIAELEQLVNEIYLELLGELADVNEELGELKGEIKRVEEDLGQELSELEQSTQESNEALEELINTVHSEILDEINSLKRKDRKALNKIRRVQSKLRNLRRLIRDVRRDVRNLEASCYTYRTYGYYYHIQRYRTYCEIYSGRNR